MSQVASHGGEATAFRIGKSRTRKGKEMSGFETATLGFYAMQSLIGLAQCGLIWMGLKQMSRSSELRESTGARRHEEVMKNHAESMTALKTLIERTAK